MGFMSELDIEINEAVVNKLNEFIEQIETNGSFGLQEPSKEPLAILYQSIRDEHLSKLAGAVGK
jgi:hypothetical protein